MRRSALILFTLGFAAVLSAQMSPTPPKPEVYLIHEEVVQPAAVARYEAATKDMLAAMTEKKIDSPLLNMTNVMLSDFHYLYVVKLGTFSNLDAMQEAWMNMTNAVGADRWRDLEARGAALTSSYNEYLAVRRPDLSYDPATPRLKPDERAYIRYQFYYLIPGKEREAEGIAKDYVALFRKKNIGEPFSIYMAAVGNDLPLLVALSWGKNRMDYEANDEKVNAALGDDVKPLQARALAITRRFETREGMIRPDLSYPMKK